SHEFFVNMSSNGMYDKTIFEAAACGCVILVSNDNLRGQVDDRLILQDREPATLASRFADVAALPDTEKRRLAAGPSALLARDRPDGLSLALYDAIATKP